MNDDYEEVKGTVEVPPNAGIRGFLRAIEEVLKLPRVQEIHVNARGNISFTHFARTGEQRQPIEVNFESILPYSIIRNSRVEELVAPNVNAAVAVGQLFGMSARDHVVPVAFVGGAKTAFWRWLDTSTGLPLSGVSTEVAFGIPFLYDRQLEDRVLVLCAAYTRASALVDVQRSYKLVIPEVQP
jgi:hypothetical protein